MSNKALMVARTFSCERPGSDPDDAPQDALSNALVREGFDHNDVQDIVLSVDNHYYVTIYADPIRSEESDRAAVERAVRSLGGPSDA